MAHSGASFRGVGGDRDNRLEAQVRARAGEQAEKAEPSKRWVYGTVKFNDGSLAGKLCDLVIWTSASNGMPGDSISYSICTNGNGDYRVSMNEPYVFEIYFKGRKAWIGSSFAKGGPG
jgi:hypothetical protein